MSAAFQRSALHFSALKFFRCILTGIATRALPATVLIAFMLASLLVHAQPGAMDRSHMLTIPAGSLEDALNALAVQAGITLSFDPDLVSGQRTDGLRGSYPVGKAMEILLKNSAIDVHRNRDGSYYLTLPVKKKSKTHQSSSRIINRDENREMDVVSMLPVKVVGKSIIGTGVKTVDLDRLQRNLAVDMADIFADEASVVVGGGTRNAQRLYVRGIEITNLNVTIDGAVQGRNLFQHRGAIGGMPPDLLKSVKVTTSPSALIGGGALGGSIRLETIDAREMLGDGRRAGGRVSACAYGADHGYNGSTSVYGAYDGVGMLASVSGTNTNDYRDGAGNFVHGSAGQDRNYFFKLSMLDKANHQLRISAQQNENSGLYRWGGGDVGYDDTAELTYQENERQTFTLDHRFSAAANPWVDWHLNAYLNDLILENIDYNTQTESKGWGTDLSNTARFKLGITQHQVTVGGDYYAEEGVQKFGGVQVGTENEVGNLGIYLQERMDIGPVLLTLGARWDDYETDLGSVIISGDNLSPNVDLEIALGFDFTVFAGYGESVRSTGIVPIQWLAETTDAPTFNRQEGVDSYGNPFEPETSTRYEVGLGFDREGLVLGNDRFDISVTCFKTEIENLIVQVGGQYGLAVTGFYNDDPVISKGWEVRATWQFIGFKTSLGYTNASTEDKDGNLIGIVRRKAASTGDRFVWDSFWEVRDDFGVGYTLEAVGGIHEGDIDRSGYMLHHVQAQWKSVIPNLDVTLAVRNLFDHYYSAQTSIERDGVAVAEVGRDVRVGVAYKF